MPLTELNGYVEGARADWKNVGLAVAVVVGHEVVYAQGFGLREAGNSAIVDANTLFQVGSTTKAFTAAALAILVEEGKVRWDDALIRHLPELRLADPELARNLTIRDALAHRSGIGDTNYWPFVAVMESDQAVAQLRSVAAEAAFRGSYRYNNLLYAVAGKVIEAASGTSWGNFVKRRLLEPIRMSRSGTSPYDFWNVEQVAPTLFGSAPAERPRIRDALDANMAMPHGWDEHGMVSVLPWQSYDNAAAAGAIVSSAADMANWVILNLNAGRFENRQILQEETLRELHATQNSHINEYHFPFAEVGESYALGWTRTVYRDTPCLAHGGGMIGFPAYVALLPDRKVGVVVLSNGSQAGREKLGFFKFALHNAVAFGIFDRLLGCAPRDWNKEFMDRARAVEREGERQEDELRLSRVQNSPASLPLQQYAGEYADLTRQYGPVRITVQGNGLQLRCAGNGAYSALLEHWQADVFRLHSNPGIADVLGPQFATFAVDSRGALSSMSVFGSTLQRSS